MLEVLQLILIFILGCVVIQVIISVYDKFHLKLIDETSYMYYDSIDNGDRIPLKFKYKGHDIELSVINKTFDRGISCYNMGTTTYIVNNKEVACLSFMECTMSTKRFMYLNSDYNTSEFYKILKVARKYYNKRFNEKYNEKHKSENYKLY